MSILKKLAAVLCSGALIAAGAIPCAAATDEPEIQVSVGTVQAAPGETVKVEMKLTDNTDVIMGFGMKLTYDAGLTVPVTVDDQSPDFISADFNGVQCMLNSSARTIAIMYFTDIAYVAQGTIAVFQMKVPANAKDGTKYKLTPVVDECWNSALQPMKCNAVSGYIEVKAPVQTTTTSSTASTTKTTATTSKTTSSTTSKTTTSKTTTSKTTTSKTTTSKTTTSKTTTSNTTASKTTTSTSATESTVATQTTTVETTTADTTATETTTSETTTSETTTTKEKTTSESTTTETTASETTTTEMTATETTTTETTASETTAFESTNTETTAESSLPYQNDFNGNGIADLADAVLLIRLFSEDETLTQAQTDIILSAELDINGDSYFNLLDVRAMLQMLHSE